MINPMTGVEDPNYNSGGILAAPKAPEPAKWDVAPTQTVEGRIKGLIEQDSPLMQQAKTKALQDEASRGRLNTSMAVGSAQDAVIKNAIPIAQQDATTFASSAKYNADSQNELNKMGVSQGYSLDTMGAQQKNKLAEMEAQSKYTLEQTGAQGANQISYAQELNKQNVDKMKGTMFENLNKNVNDILNNKDIDGLTKDSNGLTAKDRAISLLQNQFQGEVISRGLQGIDLSLLNFNKGTPATATAAPNRSQTAPSEVSAQQATIESLQQEIAQLRSSVNRGRIGRTGRGD